jgi:two-component system cell cycle sensor histidine kinase/response regulator CckA
MGSREAMRRLLENNPNVKAIVSSGYSHDPIMADHKDYDFQGVMPKPYNVGILSKAPAQVLNNRT